MPSVKFSDHHLGDPVENGDDHPVNGDNPPGYSDPLQNGHSNGKTNGHSKENGLSRTREESTSSNSSDEHDHHRVGGRTRPRSASLATVPTTRGTVIKLPNQMDYRKRQSIWSGSDKIPTQEPPATRDDPLYDPSCDPEHPKVITFQNISAAQYKLRGGIQYTPCSKSHMSQMTGMDIYFKKDLFQYTGSFKERGARNFLLHMTKEEMDRGVIATSAGNHALALSYHGIALGIPVTVVMPRNAPMMKVSLCKSYGATIILTGNNIAESKDFAMRMAKEKKLTYVNGYDHPYILAGQGTCGLEMLEQVPDMDAAIIPVGGGGLIAGIAVALKTLNPKITIIGVESDRCPGFYQALKAGKPTYTSTSSTLADGLAVPVVGFNSFATAAPLIDKMVVVKEEFIALAILRLVEMEKVVVEGAGATGLAAVLSGQLPELVGKKVVIPLTGGNIDTTILGRCLERGLATDGRMCRFRAVVTDRPGGIAELSKLLSDMEVSIKDIFHERAWLKHDVFSVAVSVVCETRDAEHAKELEASLREKYKKVDFGMALPVELTDNE